jgi:hypothetical protein
MEKKVARVGEVAGRHARTMGPWAALALAGLAACPAAWADDTGDAPAEATLVADARTGQRPLRMEVQTSALPRFESQEGGFQAPRVDFSLFPSQRARFAAVVGMSGFGPRQPNGIGFAPQSPSFDLGVRWTHKQIDVTAWRRVNAADDAYSAIMERQAVYGARVEMNIKPAQPSLFGLDKGFLGMQLESGARISVKRKNGGPMIYYRQTF